MLASAEHKTQDNSEIMPSSSYLECDMYLIMMLSDQNIHDFTEMYSIISMYRRLILIVL